MLKTSLFYLGVRGINGVLSVTSVLVLSRMLSAEQYGVYSLALATISVLATTLFQWLAAGVSRLHAAYSDQLPDLICEAYRIFAFIAVIVVILGIIVREMIFPQSEWVIAIIIGVGCIAIGLHSLNLQIANAGLDKRRYALLSTMRAFLAPVLAITAIACGFGANGAVAGFVLGALTSSLFFHARIEFQFHQNSPRARHELITFGLPLVVSLFSTTILDVSDRFIINSFLGAAAVGVYAATYDITQQTIGVALNVFYLAAFPKITRAWESGGAMNAAVTMRKLARSLILMVPVAVGIMIGLSEDLSGLLLGAAIGGSSIGIMPWVATAIALGCIKSYFLDVGLSLQKKTHRLMQITVMMAIINVALNIVLIPIFGLVGAAIATALAFLFGSIMSWMASRRLHLFSVKKAEILMALAMTILMAVMLRLIPSISDILLVSCAFKLVVGMSVYLALIWFLNVVDIREDFKKISTQFSMFK